MNNYNNPLCFKNSFNFSFVFTASLEPDVRRRSDRGIGGAVQHSAGRIVLSEHAARLGENEGNRGARDGL